MSRYMRASADPRLFDRLVRRAIRRLPPEFRAALENVAVIVEEEPEGPGELYGQYFGQPLTARAGAEPLLPDRIVLYRGPLVRACGGDRGLLAAEIERTLLHEVGHLLGLDEGRLAELGLE
jgi:predicted Zn-dependent protease with MMP-like domain